MPSSIKPEFKKSANCSTDLMPFPGSVISWAKFIELPLANVRFKDEKSFRWISWIEKVAEDWFPIEFRFIDLTDPGIVETTPSFKKEVANRGFEDLLKTSSTVEGRKLFWTIPVFPRSFRSTDPIFVELADIKFFEAAAKSSAAVNLKVNAPAFVLFGDITTLSPSWGSPITWISWPSNFNLLPYWTEIPLDELISQLEFDPVNFAVMFSCFILLGFPMITSKSNFDLL